jgi:DNA-binding transcriptional regulator GbsR (MarR family)
MGEKEAIQNLIEEFGKGGERFGFPAVLGKVYATLYLKGDMTQDELKIDISCANSIISQSLAVLENCGAVKVVGKDGRKNKYAAVIEFKDILHTVLKNKIIFQIDPFLDVVDKNYGEIKDEETRKKVEGLRKRFDYIKKMAGLMLKVPGI